MRVEGACPVFAWRFASVTKEPGGAVYSALTALARPAPQPIPYAATLDEVESQRSGSGPAEASGFGAGLWSRG